MKKVIIEYEGMTTPTELTIKGTVPFYEKHNVEYRIVRAADMTAADISWCDVLYAIRPFCYDCYMNAVAAKNAGCFYLILFDDDLLNWDEAYPVRKEYAKKCLTLADYVVSSSPLIAEEYSKYSTSHRHFASDTSVYDYEIVRTAADDVVHMVFAAGNNHEAIFNKFIEPVLDEILDAYNGKVDMTFVGVHPELKGLKNKELVHYVKGMPLAEYDEYMRGHHFDIGLAPLEDSWFCNRKYYNKYLEYAKVGICGIYSNCKPYTYIIEDGVNGVLAEPDPQAWKKAICELIDDGSKREAMIEFAQNQLRTKFSPEDLENASLDDMPELFTYQRPDKDFELTKSSLKRNVFMTKDRVYRAIYIWRHQGFKAMKETVSRHLTQENPERF